MKTRQRRVFRGGHLPATCRRRSRSRFVAAPSVRTRRPTNGQWRFDKRSKSAWRRQ